MADVQIDQLISAGEHYVSNRGGPFWISTSVGYVVYIDSDNSIVYQKSSDGGDSWGGAVTLIIASCYSFDAYADMGVDGDSGTIIHIAAFTSNDHTVKYGYLDTSDDSTGTDTIEACQGTGTFLTTQTRDNYEISLCKSRGGNICVAGRYLDSDSTQFNIFYTSPDGDTWSSKNTPWEDDTDHIQLHPANLADADDIWALFWDKSADEIDLKTFDDSGNSWSTQNISGSMTEASFYLQMDGCIRWSDGNLLASAWNLYDNANADLVCWDIANASSITAKTNILTDSSETFLVSSMYDQDNDIWYVAYAKGGTIQSTVTVYYKYSSDGGANWSAEQSYQANAADDMRWISCGVVKDTLGGYFMPTFSNHDLRDLFVNTDNAVSIAASGAGWGGEFCGVAVAEFDGITPAEIDGV